MLKELRDTYLIIDALDECVTDLKKLLKLIVQSIPSSSVKWIVSSRNSHEIERILHPDNVQVRISLELKGNAEQVANAVELYINRCVSELTQISDDERLRDKVHERLRSKANGTFLWVSFVKHQLEDVSSWNILEVIDEIPEELKEVYERMLGLVSQLPRKDLDLCRGILATVISAYRPLQLQELYVLARFPHQIRSTHTEQIVRMCGSFLTIRNGSIYIIHQSATDFLIGLKEHNDFFEGVEDIHYSIFARSLEIMSTTLRRDIYKLGSLGYAAEHIQIPDPDPLAACRYSVIHWIDHLCDSNFDLSTTYANTLREGG